MSVVLNARQVCEEALSKIGAFTTNDAAAEPEHLEKALLWLDIIMGELVGTTQIWWLITSTTTITLDGNSSYMLTGQAAATGGMQFPVLAMLDTGNNNRTPLEIVTRQVFDALPTPTSAGDPNCIHIDRLTTPTLRIYPVVAATVTPARKIILTIQSFAPNVGDSATGNVAHGLRVAWQRWAILQTAYDLGTGPVRRLTQQQSDKLLRDANIAREALLSFENKQHENTPPQVAAWNL